MDNITHSLAGLLLADATVQLRARNRTAIDGTGRGSFATVAALTGVVGANLPDGDVLWIVVLQSLGRLDELGALLQHRGYTHTFLAALLWIPLLSGTSIAALRRSTVSALIPPRRASDAGWLVLLSSVAVLSHILLDFTNDYGVHPLSPFSHQWFHGDSVFIIEPWLWVAAIPALLRNAGSRAARIILVTLLAIGVGLSYAVPQVPAAAAAIVTLGAVAWLWLARRQTPSEAVAAGISGWLSVTVCFALGTSLARANVRRLAPFDQATRLNGSERFAMADMIASATPANPVCARVITIESSATRYRLTTGWASAAPLLLSAAVCARGAGADTSLGAQHLAMRRVQAPPSAAVVWGWTWEAPRSELATLLASSCEAARWMQFARAPFWTAVGADSVMVGDLRYDRDRGVNVARFTFARRSANCTPTPAWTPPRRDVWPALGP